MAEPRQRLVPAGRQGGTPGGVFGRVDVGALSHRLGGQGTHRIKNHATFGQRAGLIEADHVNASQHLNRRLFLHQDIVLAAQSHGCRGEGQGGHQRQALRNHRRDHGDGDLLPHVVLLHGLQATGGANLTPQHHRNNDGQTNRNPADHEVQGIAQLRLDTRELARLVGNFAGSRVRTHVREQHATGTTEYARGREHHVARVLRNWIVLAGQQGFVQLQRIGGEHHGIGGHLIAALEDHHVALHQLLHGNLDGLAIAHSGCGGAVQQGDAVQLQLRLVLLHETDDHVSDHSHQEEEIRPSLVHNHHGTTEAQNQVKDREKVRTHNAPQRARRLRVLGIDLTLSRQACNVIAGEAVLGDIKGAAMRRFGVLGNVSGDSARGSLLVRLLRVHAGVSFSKGSLGAPFNRPGSEGRYLSVYRCGRG